MDHALTVQPSSLRARKPKKDQFARRMIFLIIPSAAVLVIFFVIPVVYILATSFNPTLVGVIQLKSTFTLDNFTEFFADRLYYDALILSLILGLTMAGVTLVLGYPLAYIVAKTEDEKKKTLYMILILIPMQLDLVIRMYGMMILMGDNGLINAPLIHRAWIEGPLPLMYNFFGTAVGLAELALPFMVLSLLGVIQNIDPSLEEAAHGLGATGWQTFVKITFPLSLPGVLSGTLLVFAISVSSYVVPVLMGGWKVVVMPIHIYQQISEMSYIQFGSAVAVLLFAIALGAVYVYHRSTKRAIKEFV